jgi:hypothetical protein
VALSVRSREYVDAAERLTREEAPCQPAPTPLDFRHSDARALAGLLRRQRQAR